MPKSKTVKIFADGGSRGNPGPAAVGAVLSDKNGKVLSEISEYIGEATNNVAEYMAVIYGMQEAIYQKADTIVLNTDSQLVARQLKGEYKVKDKNLRIFFGLAVNLFRAFDKVEINEIPREKNKEADALVNKVLDLKTFV